MTSGGTFFDRADELSRQVGDGKLVVTNEMNQVYAKYQELREDLKHPRGGQAHYARDGLLSFSDEYMEKLARGALTDLTGAAIGVSDDLGRNSENLAPVEFVNLRRSAHGTVTDDGAVVYDRAPDVGRLSKEQLRAQRHRGHGIDYGADTRPRL